MDSIITLINRTMERLRELADSDATFIAFLLTLKDLGRTYSTLSRIRN